MDRTALEKEYASLPFSDNFIFTHVMENLKIAAKVIKLILSEELPDIFDTHVEKVVETSVGVHDVRYDVYVRTPSGGVIYNIEMQQLDRKNLPKRMRYYQATGDTSFLQKNTDYNALPKYYTVFICKYDPFGHGLALYQFQNYDTVNHIPLGDDTYKVVLNVNGRTDRKELQSFMDYVRDGIVSDNTTREIDEEVHQIRQSSILMKDYIDMKVHDDEMKNEGRAEGRAEGRLELLKKAVASLKSSMSIEAIVKMFEISELERKMLAI